MKFSQREINLAVEAMYENIMDGRFAEAYWDGDFERATIELRHTFEEFLRERDS